MKATKNYTEAGQPKNFFLFIGNSMYECDVVKSSEKAVRVKRVSIGNDGSLVYSHTFYNWYPKSALLMSKHSEVEFELAKWLK